MYSRDGLRYDTLRVGEQSFTRTFFQSVFFVIQKESGKQTISARFL